MDLAIPLPALGDVLPVVELVVGAFVTFLVANIYFKQSFRREIRLNAIETLIKQLGIKDFHPKDLNSDKLDDKGYLRLLGLIQTLYATQTNNYGGASAAVNEANRVLQQMQAYNQQVANLKGQPQGQPTTP